MSVFNHGYLCLSLFVICYIQNVPCQRYGNTFDVKENALNDITDRPTANGSKYHLPNTNDIHHERIGVNHRYYKALRHRPVTRQYDFDSPSFVTRVPQVGPNRMPLRNFVVYPSYHRNLFNYNEIMNTLLSNGSRKNRYKIGNESDLFDESRDTKFLCTSDKDCNVLLENSVCTSIKNPYGLNFCKCLPNLVLMDDECVNVDGYNVCSSHKDCEAIEKSRCTYLMTTDDTKICKCPPNYTIDNSRCLIKVETGGICESTSQCPSSIPCLMNICRPYCPYGYSRKDDSCVRDLPPDIDPRYIGEPTMSNTAILVGIVGGVIFLIVMVLSMVAFVLRSRMSDGLRHTSSPTGPYASSVENSGQTVRPVSSSLMSDVPPSYDEIMTSSTATLTTNAYDQSADHLPSYKSWEEDCCNRPKILNH